LERPKQKSFLQYIDDVYQNFSNLILSLSIRVGFVFTTTTSGKFLVVGWNFDVPHFSRVTGMATSRHLFSGFRQLADHLLYPYLILLMTEPFPKRSAPCLLNTAPLGGLKPLPVQGLWWVSSTILITA